MPSRNEAPWIESNTVQTPSLHTISSEQNLLGRFQALLNDQKKVDVEKPRPSQRGKHHAPETSPSGPHIWNSNCCWKTIGSSPQMRYDKVTRWQGGGLIWFDGSSQHANSTRHWKRVYVLHKSEESVTYKLRKGRLLIPPLAGKELMC